MVDRETPSRQRGADSHDFSRVAECLAEGVWPQPSWRGLSQSARCDREALRASPPTIYSAPSCRTSSTASIRWCGWPGWSRR